MAQTRGLVVNLRKTYDQLVTESVEKRDILKDMQDMFHQREKQDNYSVACIGAAEDMMGSLEEKLRVIKHALRDSERLHHFYKKLILECERNPVTDKTWLEILEKRMDSVDLEMEALNQQRDLADVETRNTLSKVIPVLEKQMDRNKMLHDDVIEQIHSRINYSSNQLQSMFDRHNRRLVLRKEKKEDCSRQGEIR